MRGEVVMGIVNGYLLSLKSCYLLCMSALEFVKLLKIEGFLLVKHF